MLKKSFVSDLLCVCVPALLLCCESGPASDEDDAGAGRKNSSPQDSGSDTPDAGSDLDTGSDSDVDADADADSGEPEECVPMKVLVPPYEYVHSNIAEIDPAYLNDLATEYVCQLDGAPVDDAYFMYGWAPVRLFNNIIDGEITDIKKMRWVFYVSGYFGGVWLQNGLSGLDRPDGGIPFDPDAGPVPGQGGFALVDGVKIAKKAVAAVYGTDEELFEYNRESLLAMLVPDLGIAWDFGYNRGFLLEIYLEPPQTVDPPEDYVKCFGLIWCTYDDQRVPVLPSLKGISEKLGSEAGRWETLREGDNVLVPGVKKSQSQAIAGGKLVWGTVFDKNKLGNYDFYMHLLDVSASFLEVVQAAGLFSAKGYAEMDVDAGTTGAMIQSGLGMWLSSYMLAFSGGSTVSELGPVPRIVPE